MNEVKGAPNLLRKVATPGRIAAGMFAGVGAGMALILWSGIAAPAPHLLKIETTDTVTHKTTVSYDYSDAVDTKQALEMVGGAALMIGSAVGGGLWYLSKSYEGRSVG